MTTASKTEDLSTLRLPELQQRFKTAVGEATRSPNRTFLIRRIREAQGATAGSAPAPKAPRTGTAKRRAERAAAAPARAKAGRMMVLPVRLDAGVVRRLDAAYKRQGIKSRMDLFRQALCAFLRAAGENEVAALFA